jgi:two-component system phosphate regulon sensor histidine kinase PhoR
MEYFMFNDATEKKYLNQQITTETSNSSQFQTRMLNGGIQEIDLNQFSSAQRTGSSKDAIIRVSEQYQMSMLLRTQYYWAIMEEAVNDLRNAPNLKPIEDRIQSNLLQDYLTMELSNNGLEIPFIFMVVDKDNNTIFQNASFDKPPKAVDVITQSLFPGDPASRRHYLKIYFPTKKDYITSSVSFFVPSILFSFILLVTFTFTIYTIFRQKKLSDMKNDFVNNMTHELKTPVSTISLAGQMLKDTDIVKNPDVFRHISGVINDETKRLGFLVEKVLQISLFERQKATLKLKEVDANDLLVSIANTFALKVEKFDGHIDIDLEAEESAIYVDEMHITNVLFNLLDNALKYRNKDVPLQLMARTRNDQNKLYISIEDNGIGVKKEHLKKIFERFYRVPTGNVHEVKGFGLGLAYVRKIIEDHGGTIRAEQEEKFTGTKFIITLPLIKHH